MSSDIDSDDSKSVDTHRIDHHYKNEKFGHIDFNPHASHLSVNDKIDNCIRKFFSNLTISPHSKIYKLW